MKSFLKKYVHKFKYAIAGLFDGILHDHSIALQATLGLLVIIVCAFLSLSWYEWVIILAMILLVLSAEFINSCIEGIVDIICISYDERAKRIKDYGAAMVLLISLLAAIVGLTIIGGKLF